MKLGEACRLAFKEEKNTFEFMGRVRKLLRGAEINPDIAEARVVKEGCVEVWNNHPYRPVHLKKTGNYLHLTPQQTGNVISILAPVDQGDNAF